MIAKMNFSFLGNRKLRFLFIMLLMSAASYAQQQLKIQGKVTASNDNATLGGISVTIKGTTRGTVTSADGIFELALPANSVLVFSYVGYQQKEVKVTSQAFLDVQLAPLDETLSNVVVIGYGSQQKRDVTGAVTTVSTQQIRDLPVPGIDQKLVGQVAGVQVSTVTGTPGGGASIKIRGSGSIGAGDAPLFVIDGFPISNSFGQTTNPLGLLNPDDIESITILKDASSTAIYGSRGANGVVVVTTKQGKRGTPQVDLSLFAGIQQVPQKGRPDLLNGTEFAQFQKDKIVDRLLSLGQTATDADIPEAYRNPAQYGEGTNWYDVILHTAPQVNINADVKGGNETARYLFSLDYFKQDGTIRYTGYERYTIRTNFDVNLTKKLRVGLNLAPTFYNQDLNQVEVGNRDILARSQYLSPIVPVFDNAGNRTIYISSPGTFGSANPLLSLQYAGTKAKGFNALGNAFAEYEILNGLKIKYSFLANYATASSFVFNPSYLGGTNVAPPSIPNSTTAKSSLYNWLSEGLLTYRKTFKEVHQFDALLGYSAQREKNESLTMTGNNYPDDLIQTINAAGNISTYGQDVQKWSILSYLARVNYSYDNRYLITATIRRDGSSRFGANERYGTFPSAAVGWHVSEEKFMKGSKWINDLKLRASYGLSGNYNIGNYTYLSNIGSANYSFGNTLVGGRVSNSLNNVDLTWEESSQIDAGIDLAVLNSRLTFAIDLYRRETNGMLINNEIPRSSGFANQIINSGKVRNQGLEIAVTSNNLTGAFTWTTSANIAFNDNKVLALNENNATIYSGRDGGGNFTHITEVGKPLGQFYGYILEGIYMDANDLSKSPKHASSVIGSRKYKDVDGNGVIEAVKDFAVLGQVQPDFIWGLTNNLAYKGFDLNIILIGTQGGNILKASNEYLLNIDGIFNVDRVVLNRWRSPQSPGDGLTPTTNGGTPLYRNVNSSWVEGGSYMRIQNISLGYTFNSKILQRTGWARSARVYLSGQNLNTFTKYSGANPDVSIRQPTGNATTVALVPGVDYSNYPLAKSFNLGLNISF